MASDADAPEDSPKPEAAKPEPADTEAGSAAKGRKPLPEKKEVASFISGTGLLGMITFNPARHPRVQFAVWKQGGTVCVEWEECPLANGPILVPPGDRNGLIPRKVVLLPSGVADYGTQDELVAEILLFTNRYADVPPFWAKLIAHYVLMTWVYERFSAVPYLRFLGEPQSGKTRCLQVAAHLCYKAIIGGGATTASPLFRLLEIYSGTFVIDEADYQKSELSSEIIKILNCGYMRGLPVLKSEMIGNTYEPRAFDVFGPKILTTRKEFGDRALETRCLTRRTGDQPIRADIPRQLPNCFYSEALALRNKLLRWRFDNFLRIQSDESQLLALEPRLTQIGAPLYSVSTDANFRAELVQFLNEQAEDDREVRPAAIIAEAISQLFEEAGFSPATLRVQAVSDRANFVRQDWGAAIEAFTPKGTGGLIRALGFPTRKGNTGFKFTLTESQLADLIARYPAKSGEEE